MKAVQIHGYKDVPTLEEVPTPEVGPGEVLVRVHAAALNPIDVQLQVGGMERFFPLTFPYTLGLDLSGTIERVGTDASVWKPEDRIIARLSPARGGALAEFVAVSSDACVALPPELPMTDGAGIPTAGGTAWKALFEVAQVKAGQTVLIHAGAGGVGSFAVQFAHAFGVRVLATASGDGLELVRGLGADQVMDYRTQDFATVFSGLDVVLDTIGGDTQRRSFDVLRAGGYLVSTVAPPDEALAKSRGVSSSMVQLSRGGIPLKEMVATMHDHSLRVLTDRTLPLDRFAEALERQASGRARGKIILTVT